MPGKRHSSDQILRKLREADELRSHGVTTREICKQIEVAENTYRRWKHQYGGLDGHQKRRLAELEGQNGRLKQLVADLSLDLLAARSHARLTDDGPLRRLVQNGETRALSM
jgi:putative transposase